MLILWNQDDQKKNIFFFKISSKNFQWFSSFLWVNLPYPQCNIFSLLKNLKSIKNPVRNSTSDVASLERLRHWARVLVCRNYRTCCFFRTSDLLRRVCLPSSWRWIDSLGNWAWNLGAVRPGQKVGHATEDADVGLRSDLFERFSQNFQAAALQDLSTGHQRTILAVHGDHMTLDVGIADDCEDQRHRRDFVKFV